MASLAERTASPWTATSMRDRPAGCSTCASSLCGAVCGNGRSPAADIDGLLVPIGWRRGFGAAPAMMVPRRRGATNTTLAATQRHPCRSGMVTADCALPRSCPETVVTSGRLPWLIGHFRRDAALHLDGFGVVDFFGTKKARPRQRRRERCYFSRSDILKIRKSTRPMIFIVRGVRDPTTGQSTRTATISRICR